LTLRDADRGGDHRQYSSDSRHFGPVEVSHVIGRAWLRYWPLDAFGAISGPRDTEASAAERSAKVADEPAVR
jgi:hypothetical protein